MRDTPNGDIARLAAAAGGKSLGVKVPGWVGTKRGNKFNAKKTEYAGIMYDSGAEASRARQLDYLIQLGEVRFWVRQVTIRLGVPECVYKIDYLVVGKDDVWAEDVKGMATQKFKRDVKLWRRYGPCNLHVITKGKTEIILGGADRSHA